MFGIATAANAKTAFFADLPPQKNFTNTNGGVISALFMDWKLSILPIIAALFYSLSVVLVKAASGEGGVRATSMLAATNLMLAVVFVPVALCADLPPAGELWEPLIVGIFFALANYTTFLCAHYGEVSLMTPIMGVKVLLVFAAAAVIAGVACSPAMLAAGVLCCAAVFIMGFDKSSLAGGKLLPTIALALTTCTFYALCDVLVCFLGKSFDPFSFLGMTSVVLAVSSLPFMRQMCADFRPSNKSAGAGLAAAAFMAFESMLMFRALAGGLDAGLCNIFYNTRGLMSIALVYFLANKYPELEKLSRASAQRRIFGSIMILVAVGIACVS